MKNSTYPHKDSSPAAQNDTTAHSDSLKAVRGILKRLPHSLRSFAVTDFLLSGSLKVFLILFIVFSANSAFADEISSTASYSLGGKYRMFGAGRGEVEKSDEW